ncbi:MAG: hypothetical protein ACRDFX_13050 [Chloroflexota bacterium]
MPRLAFVILLGVAVLLAGCAVSLPSQQHPVCSWDSQPPKNAQLICDSTFRTLRALIKAVVHNDRRAIRHLVTNPRVVKRIEAYGTLRRGQGIVYLHIVPSLTLELTKQSYIGAGFFVTGKTHQGNVSDQEVLYLLLHHGTALVAEDQPNQIW